MLKYHLKGVFQPDAASKLIETLKKLALDTRNEPEKNQYNLQVFFQYAQAANFTANLNPLRNILEIGRGYSTMLFAFLKRPETRLFSIDAKPIEDYDIAEPLGFIEKHVDFINGFTVTDAEIKSFYSGQSKDNFLDTDASKIKDAVLEYIRPSSGEYAKALDLDASSGNFANACLEALFDGRKLRCLGALFPEILTREMQYAETKGPGVLDGLLKKVDVFDSVFLDCGEFSSMIEWMKVKDQIRKGGLAIFHDIYFPKSVKNFLACAAIRASKDWKILYRDATTPQGLIIARRV
ncbi:MAG: hypothetical protein SVS15_05855 [Thermodesulfobacteriota bacterium]|nr:hypothetical protein [Thermodesulfobacteriota bacterium]